MPFIMAWVMILTFMILILVVQNTAQRQSPGSAASQSMHMD